MVPLQSRSECRVSSVECGRVQEHARPHPWLWLWLPPAQPAHPARGGVVRLASPPLPLSLSLPMFLSLSLSLFLLLLLGSSLLLVGFASTTTTTPRSPPPHRPIHPIRPIRMPVHTYTLIHEVPIARAPERPVVLPVVLILVFVLGVRMRAGALGRRAREPRDELNRLNARLRTSVQVQS